MGHYLIRRILLGFVTLFLITFVVFGLIRAMPGDATDYNLAESDPSKLPSQEDIERTRKELHLDEPFYIAYFPWLWDAIRLDFGTSIPRNEPVLKLIGERIGPTLLLSISSLVLTYLLAVPMGLYSTVRRNKTDERTLTTILYMLYAVPSFVAALLLLLFFYEKVKIFPSGGMHSPGYAIWPEGAPFDPKVFFEGLFDLLWHMCLPVACYTYGALAFLSRFIKSNMEEVIRQDYIRTARAKGVHPAKVVCWHAFRNTMIPFLTMIGLTLPALLGGSIILEQIFSWPGMGQLFFQSLTMRDFPVLMALTLMFAVLTLLGQLLADLLYAVADPRITYS